MKSSKMTIKEEYKKMVKEFDKSVLSLLRKQWLDEKNISKKREIMNKIDNALDERLRLMSIVFEK
jgi:LPS O-antigen subunit length determinant protein (WzzB/FepE family)